MNYFLAKTDPETYSIDDLERDVRTMWDGVRNAQAVQAIRQWRPGDLIFIYHSMGQSAVVGLARVNSLPVPDPKEAKSVVAEIEYLRRLNPATTLAEIKSSGLFADWALVRQSRLSTMAAPEEFVEWMRSRYPNAGI